MSGLFEDVCWTFPKTTTWEANSGGGERRGDARGPAPEEFALAALMSQATLSKLEWCGNLLGVVPPSYHFFVGGLGKIEKILKRLANLSMEENLRSLPNKELFAMSDCGWNFRNEVQWEQLPSSSFRPSV